MNPSGGFLRPFSQRWSLVCSVFITALFGVAIAPVLAGTTSVFETPSDDQWQYPFNFSPGVNSDRSVFAASTPPFDARDAMAIVRWDTSGLIPAGRGPEAYSPTAVKVRVWEPAGAAWNQTATQSIQLFGVGFGPTYTEAGWTEFTSVKANGGGPPTLRDPYPMTLDGDRAENDINATPWATGSPDPDTSSARPIEFDLDLEQPAILDYVRQGLSLGRISFAVSSTLIPDSSMTAPGSLPRVIFKEGVPLHPGSSAPELTVAFPEPSLSVEKWKLY